ncbi:MAG TPA: YncE family protein [Chitinophagaceae bacterium]|jgi:DNA-binding beta-propeller fold protein YncE|nr:YncE family protein [Chitinophagaceae bacterium]
MIKSWVFFLLLLACCLCNSCHSQKTFGTDELTLRQTIPLANVKGRIDHMDADIKKQVVFMSALGNNSLEIVDIKNGKHLHSIKKLSEPQGVIFIPQTNEIMVANGGDGRCQFYNAETFQTMGTIELGSDADDIRYDSVDRKVYVGYGRGGIAEIDPVKHLKTADVKLSEHPEGFQLDKSLKKIFVNVPDANQIDVIDLKSAGVIAKWKTEYSANFPMAIDESGHIIFIGYRHPAELVAIDENTGKTIAVTGLIGDADDLYYDGRSKKIYASGGSGAINVYLFENAVFKQISGIPTRSGARTSLLIPALNAFILAERATGNEAAQLSVYNVK